jgi:hypothetical protein
MNGVAPSIDLRCISFPATDIHNKSSDSTLKVYIQGSISIDQINNRRVTAREDMTPINTGTSDINISTGCDITKKRIIGVY